MFKLTLLLLGWTVFGHAHEHHHHHHGHFHSRHLEDGLTNETEGMDPNEYNPNDIVCNATKLGDKDLAALDAAANTTDESTRRQLQSSSPIDINVYFHVITDRGRGRLSSTAISRQMSYMNIAFRNSRFRFRLARTNYVENSEWYRNGLISERQQQNMKERLRQGGPQDLNVYTTDSPPNDDGGRLLGLATFPSSYRAEPDADGVVCYFETFPGGRNTGFNLGGVTVHEVGHWLGLYHTFQGGCRGGDAVSDTAAEASFASGCPIGRNTCSAAGLDPIRNYMDYTTDSCKVIVDLGFTRGQINRMHSLWFALRANAERPPPNAPVNPSTPAPSSVVRLDIIFVYDRFPQETSFGILDSSNNLVAGVGRGQGRQTLRGFVELAAGRYTFVILDSAGDGTCCGYGNGGYQLSVGNRVVLRGNGRFGSRLARRFRISGSGAFLAEDEAIAEASSGTIGYWTLGSLLLSIAGSLLL